MRDVDSEAWIPLTNAILLWVVFCMAALSVFLSWVERDASGAMNLWRGPF
jgi:hypothetical protein